MLASFLIPFHSKRIDNLLQTLRFLQKRETELVKQSELILLCQDMCGKIDTVFQKFELHNFRLPEMEKCKMLNEGVEKSRAKMLIFLDSDRVLPANYFQDVLAKHEPHTAVTTRFLRRIDELVSVEDLENNQFSYTSEDRSVTNEPFYKNLFSGNVVISKEDYKRSGGMDERYIGYGWEDHDMTETLLAAGMEPVWRDDIELHLYHEPKTYGVADQQRLFLKNGLYYCRKWKKPIPKKLTSFLNSYSKNLR